MSDNYVVMTEDGHMKAECLECGALEHVNILMEKDTPICLECEPVTDEEAEAHMAEASETSYKDILAEYMAMMPIAVVHILTEEDHRYDPYITLQEYVEGREWHETTTGHIRNYFEYEGGWSISLFPDNKFYLFIEDKFGNEIEFGGSYNLHDLEIKLHAYESLRYANMVW